MNYKELAKRAVACKGWKWLQGMQGKGPLDTFARISTAGDGERAMELGFTPDLTDPATLGCLLSLVREVWGDRCACALAIDYGPAGEKWVVRLTVNGRSLTERHWDTEAEALVAALEAAP
jgi:hypothetical protein